MAFYPNSNFSAISFAFDCEIKPAPSVFKSPFSALLSFEQIIESNERMKMNVVVVPYTPRRQMYFATEENFSRYGTKLFDNYKNSSQVSD